MANTVVDPGPLDWRTSIVDKSGRPSPEFQRRWNTNRNNTALIGFITFGSGPPPSDPTPDDGAQYIDISTTPYSLYVGQDSEWNLVTPLSANPTATAGPSAIDGTATTYMRSDAAPAIQKGLSSQFGVVKSDGATVISTAGILSVPTATVSLLGLVKPDGTTVTINTGVLSVPTATTSLLGLVKPDGTTITISGGVISGVAAGVTAYFGASAPTTLHNQGDLYFQTSTTPYTPYVCAPVATAPTIVQSTTGWTNASSIAYTLPAAPTPGNLLVEMHITFGSASPPTGWTNAGIDAGGGSTYMAVNYRYAQVGDTATPPGFPAASYGGGVLLELAAVPGTWLAALDTHQQGTNGTTGSTPMTTSAAHELAVMFLADAFFGSTAPTASTGWTLDQTNTGPIYPVGLAHEAFAAGGSSVSITSSVANYFGLTFKGSGSGLAWEQFGASGGGGGGGVILESGGTSLGTATTLNITGSGQTTSFSGGVGTINIPGGGGGSAWDFVPPHAADFGTLVGTVTPNLTDDSDVGLILDSNGLASGDTQRGAVKALPGSGDWNVIIKQNATLQLANYNCTGIFMYEAGTSKVTIFGLEYGNTSNYRITHLTSPSGFNGNPYDVAKFNTDYHWFKVAKVGTVLNYYMSADGKFWSLIYTENVNAFFTSGPDHIGLGFSLNISGGPDIGFSVPYWYQSF